MTSAHKDANVFITSVIHNVFTVSLSTDLITRFASLLSEILDLWNVLVEFYLLRCCAV